MGREDELYRQYLAGNPSAGDQLMLYLGDQLTGYLYAFVHNTQDSEDLMLDCFSEILVRKPKIREGCFRAYLFRMARYKANRLWRLRLKRKEFTLEEAQASREHSPEEKAKANERSAVLNRCLNRIAPQYREALWMVYEMDMSYSQAATVLGCGNKRVEDLLRNGKKRLRLELEKEGITRADL